MDLTALQTAVSDLKAAVDKIAPAATGASDDQAAVDELTSEVQQLVDELTPASASPVSADTTSPAPADSSGSSADPAGVGAWTPPGS